MHVSALVGFAFLTLVSSAPASPFVSSDDSELMRIEALADRAPDRIHGSADYIFDEEDAYVDATTGTNPLDPNNCSQVPVRMKRTDGTVVTRRIGKCD
jgi:hypothetical protein